MAKYGISTDVFDSYVADFHGTTVMLFEKTHPGQATNKAVCIDCHGVHDIAPATHDSQLIQANILPRCQECHPDATSNFAASWLGHYAPNFETAPLVTTVTWFYRILIPLVIGLLRGLHWPGRLPAHQGPARPDEGGASMSENTQRYVRFLVSDRVLHLLLLVSFSLLALTGLVQKYADARHLGAL